jgi:hypothetical protein
MLQYSKNIGDIYLFLRQARGLKPVESTIYTWLSQNIVHNYFPWFTYLANNKHTYGYRNTRGIEENKKRINLP